MGSPGKALLGQATPPRCLLNYSDFRIMRGVVKGWAGNPGGLVQPLNPAVPSNPYWVLGIGFGVLGCRTCCLRSLDSGFIGLSRA